MNFVRSLILAVALAVPMTAVHVVTADITAEAKGKKAKKKMMPIQPGDVKSTVADIRRLRKLGWKPTTRIEVGIKNFVEWYRGYFGA